MELFYSYNKKCMIQQINKTAAKKYFEDGKKIFLQSSKMKFDNFWQSPAEVSKEDLTFGETFETLINSYNYYNCDCERGNYIKFFIRETDSYKKLNNTVKTLADFERLPDSLKNEVSKRKINYFFRLMDQSNSFPIFGKFNATERAIRRIRRNFPGLQGLEYYLTLDSEVSRIVNAEI